MQIYQWLNAVYLVFLTINMRVLAYKFIPLLMKKNFKLNLYGTIFLP